MSFLKSILLFAAFCVTLFVMPQQTNAARAFYVFGDSLVDSGNNNYLVTTARADSPPYGIDYPTGRPTGRFSNGLNLPDIISTYDYEAVFKLFNYLLYLELNLLGGFR